MGKTNTIHSTTKKAEFLGYGISCTPRNKMPADCNSRRRLVIIKTPRVILNAPIKKVVEQLRIKSFLNKKNQPTRCSRYINMDLWNIVDSYKSIERGIINYYSMANNYGRLAARVHYSLKYSCALTICSKMKLKTMRRVFKQYGENLEVKDGDKSIFYSTISYKRPRKFTIWLNDNFSFENFFERLIYRYKRHVEILKGLRIVRSRADNIEKHAAFRAL